VVVCFHFPRLQQSEKYSRESMCNFSLTVSPIVR
jgi:hypothetical protein